MKLLVALLSFVVCSAAFATSNYHYGPDEYVTVSTGMSPDGAFAITAHGEGEMGYDKFHLYLTNATSGKKIGVLEELASSRDALDTGADAYAAIWSKDSSIVTIVWRIDRHAPLLACTYRIAKGRAIPLKGGTREASDSEVHYWGKHQQSGKIFGTPLKKKDGE